MRVAIALVARYAVIVDNASIIHRLWKISPRHLFYPLAHDEHQSRPLTMPALFGRLDDISSASIFLMALPR